MVSAAAPDLQNYISGSLLTRTKGNEFDLAQMHIAAAIDGFQSMIDNEVSADGACLDIISHAAINLIKDYLDNQTKRPLPAFADPGHPNHENALRERYHEHLDVQSPYGFRADENTRLNKLVNMVDKEIQLDGVSFNIDQVPDIIDYLKKVRKERYAYADEISDGLTDLANKSTPETRDTLAKLGIPLSKDNFQSIDNYLDVKPGNFVPSDGKEYDRDNPKHWLEAMRLCAKEPEKAISLGIQLQDPAAIDNERRVVAMDAALPSMPIGDISGNGMNRGMRNNLAPGM